MAGFLVAAFVGVTIAGASPSRGLELATPAPDGRRVALVIGNGDYEHATDLVQAPRDAQRVADSLDALGFTVHRVLDADRRQASQALRTFESSLDGASVGFFYYAGHAVQVDGINYLVPVDAALTEAASVEVEAVDTRRIQQLLERTRAPIGVLVLDACRNNPFVSQWRAGSRSFGTRGLAQMATRGLLIAYATNPGNVATDSGVYATALTRALTTPCQSLTDAFFAVRDEVLNATGGHQVPWIGGSPGLAFSRYQPAGCNGEAPDAVAPAVVAPAPVDERRATLEDALTRARNLYQQRCVTEFGGISTAQERKACHARYHPAIEAAQEALDAHLLAAP